MRPTLIFLCIGLPSLIIAQTIAPVKIWQEDLVLPTYIVDPPEQSPMFFENDSYQGASRVIYPYALQDDFTNKKENKTYKAVYLENEFLKVCILPEIGGRLFYATDKTNGYEIFYRQHVIKPAHIGMLGAWISGGIEFCVFHHHRATTNVPVDYDIVQNEDGSATLWIGETERRHRMKWTFGISLYPGKAYLELDGRMINPTENANAILYWANVATHVNDDYQVIFPPSTQFAVYHAKNSFAHWPITREAYRGNDYYRDSIDASWWKNHPTANSFFAHDLKEGFLAGYDHSRGAGTMLVANPHIVKGAKLWEWGPGPKYAIWDTQVLTDEDGPYAELMSGAYSDNQPDYSWIKPYEIKRFKQYWYPMRKTDGALTANLNGLLNLKKVSGDQLLIAANTTTTHQDAKIVLKRGEQVIFTDRIAISPGQPFRRTIRVAPPVDTQALHLALYDAAGDLLVAYTPTQLPDNPPLPATVNPPPKPADIASLEELYFTGLRLKQFYNARIDPTDYFTEALQRDVLDVRCNTQMGIVHKEKGAYPEAAAYFRKALVRVTKDYTRPRDGEALYQLGLILQAQGQLSAAYDTLYRAAWDYAYASPAYFHLAQISTQQKNYERALNELERSLEINASNISALNLKSAVLRNLGKITQAKAIAHEVIKQDPLNFWSYHELLLLDKNPQNAGKLTRLLRDEPESYLEVAVAYLNAGLTSEAEQVLLLASKSDHPTLAQYPTVHYYLGYIKHLAGAAQAAKDHFAQAQELATDYCFPFRLETIKVYETALQYHPADAKAYYYLGNLLYDKQPGKAIGFWEQATQHDPTMAMAYRNLGWGYNQTEKNLAKAIDAYETAIAKNGKQARYYDELDRLYERYGTPIEKRYEVLSANHQVIAELSRPLIREAMVAVAMEKYDAAIEILTTNYFNRQEGSNDLHDIYVDALLLRGKRHLQEQNAARALADFNAADLYPANQSIGRDEASERRAQIFYLTGLALEQMGDREQADTYYQRATEIEVRTPEYLYQQALAQRKLGYKAEATVLFNQLATSSERMLRSGEETDFFSKFGGSQADNKRKATANYLQALAFLGANEKEQARVALQEAIRLNPGHAWAKQLLREVE